MKKELSEKVNSKGENRAYRAQKKKKYKGKVSEADVSEKPAKLENNSRFGDPNWYFMDKDLAEQASRFSFQSFIGDGTLISNAKLPSICTLYLNPSLGGYVGYADAGADESLNWMKDPSISSVNMIARKIYSRLSNKSGRTQAYAPQDVMTLILAMGEVVSIASHLKRVIGLSFTYNWRNRDFPTQIIKALGVDPDDFLANLSVYRVRFNTVLNIANKIPFPGNIAWFSKCNALYEGIFKDSPDDMAQIYAFVPATTWIIDEDDYEGGTILKTVDAACPTVLPTPVAKTFAQWLDLLRSMIDALLTSSTYNVIFGDILNMCSTQDVPLLHLNIVPEDYSVIPEYNAEVLLHIHNSNCYIPIGSENVKKDDSEMTRSRYNDVFPDPDTNNLLYAPQFNLATSHALDGIDAALITYKDELNIVDFPYGDPDLTERIEATRFAIRFGFVRNGDGEGADYIGIAQALPDHYVTRFVIWTAGQLSSIFPYSYSAPNSGLTYAQIADIEKFRYAPLLYKARNTDVSGGASYVYGDINYFTTLGPDWMQRMDDLCLQGLLELR